MNRIEIKENARKIIKGNLWKIFGILFLVALLGSIVTATIKYIYGMIFAGFNISLTETVITSGITTKINTLAGNIFSIIETIVTLMISFVSTHYMLNFVRGNKIDISESINFLFNNILNIFIVSLLHTLIIELGYLLLVIPGIIASIGLIFVPEILVDNPNLKNIEVLKKSWNMMMNHKMNYFVFMLSFLGWLLLCVFLIPMVYVIPYLEVARILYYENIK